MAEGSKEERQEVSGTSRRVAAWLAWSLAGVSVVMFVASIGLWALARSAPVPSSWGADLTIANMLGELLFLAFPLVGALIASRHPHNPIGWILLADGFLWVLGDMLGNYSVYGLARPGSVPFPVGFATLSDWLWVPAVGLLGIYVLLLFPDGRLPSRRWRSLAWLSGAVIVMLSLAVLLGPGPLESLGGVRNPFGMEGQPWIVGGYVALPLLPLCMLASAASLVLRYRRSRGEQREQIKWIAFAASLVGVVYLVAMVASLIHPSESWTTAGSVWWLNLLTYAALLSFITVPVAVGFAVLKYHLYNIDFIINRTLVYGVLTAILVAVYFGGIVVMQRLFIVLTGEKSTLAVVASTLLIAALFNPLRRRIQYFIDRRFYRRKYDARKTLEALSARLRDETDLDALRGDLVGVVRESLQPAHVTLWLQPERVAKGSVIGEEP